MYKTPLLLVFSVSSVGAFAFCQRKLWNISTTGLFQTALFASRKRIRPNTPKESVESTVVILYHKPKGFICSHSSTNGGQDEERITVYDDVKSMEGYVESVHNGPTLSGESFEKVTKIRSKLHAIGRLDSDTSGLLLLTNDGGLVHHVTNPNSQSHNSSTISKTYEALIMGHFSNNCPPMEQIRTRGVDIGEKYGGLTRPAQELNILEHPSPKTTLVSITINEGKNRQIRRMFHGVGSGVMRLHRKQVGNVTIGNLSEGQWLCLGDNEIWHGLKWRVRSLHEGQGLIRRKKVPKTKRKRRRN